MNPREQLLGEVEQALVNQLISAQDLEQVLSKTSDGSAPVAKSESAMTPPALEVTETKPKSSLSVIDVLFYLAGVILFAALMTMVSQVGRDSLATRLMISLGAGLLFWTAAFVFNQQSAQNDTRAGLINSLLLTGSLSVVAGSFLLSFDLVGDQSTSSALAYAGTLAILGVVHVLFDRILRNSVLIIFGLLLFVLAFPTAMVGLLASTKPPADVWGVIGIITAFLLAYGGRLASLSAPNRQSFKASFESLAGFTILASIYAMIFASSIVVLWELLLPLTIYLAFFISIKRRSKQFLVTGSLFLVVFLITISFKYFSGLGAAFSLVLSAFSILATAFVAASINKKYIKQ